MKTAMAYGTVMKSTTHVNRLGGELQSDLSKGSSAVIQHLRDVLNASSLSRQNCDAWDTILRSTGFIYGMKPYVEQVYR